MVYLYSMQAFALAMVVHCTASRSYTMVVLEVDCGFDAVYLLTRAKCCGPSNLALLLIRAGCPKALGKGDVQPHSHRCSVSSGRLQLSSFKPGVRSSSSGTSSRRT
jgi:hypothetical protein